MAAVEQKVKQIIVEQLGVDESQVDSNASFVDDLGADSLDIVELVMAFEEAFELEIPDEDAEKITTVKDAVEYIEEQDDQEVAGSSRSGRIVLSRRVVVTGVGLLTPLGIGTEMSWEAHSRGQERHRADHRSLTPRPSPAGSPARSKASTRRSYIEKKEIKKMGRFIQFAIAAADFALKDSGLKVTPENAERVGVYIGSGIGGFEVIEREHKTLLEHGPRRISPFFIPATIINLASGYVSIRRGAKGPEFGHGHRLHHQRALHRRFVPDDPARRRRCHDLRRQPRRRSRPWASAGSRPCARFPRATTNPSAPRARGTRIATGSWWAKAPAF